MKEYQPRQESINLHLQGGKVTAIARLMGKSHKWLHHCIKRYKNNSGNENWFKDESKAPKRISGTLEPQKEQQILFIRKGTDKREDGSNWCHIHSICVSSAA